MWGSLKARPDIRVLPSGGAAGIGVRRAARAGLNAFVRLVSAMVDGGREAPLPPAQMINLVLDRFYQDYIENTFSDAPARLEDVRQLAEFAMQYDATATFLSEWALMGAAASASPVSAEAEEGTQEALVLSSVHQAKGLEWRVVFLIWLTDARFPLARALADPGGEEEERRLFYVALTRAKDEVYMCQPALESQTWNMGAFSRLSRYVGELPEELYERWLLEEVTESADGDAEGGEAEGGSRLADPDEPDGLRYEYDAER